MDLNQQNVPQCQNGLQEAIQQGATVIHIRQQPQQSTPKAQTKQTPPMIKIEENPQTEPTSNVKTPKQSSAQKPKQPNRVSTMSIASFFKKKTNPNPATPKVQQQQQPAQTGQVAVDQSDNRKESVVKQVDVHEIDEDWDGLQRSWLEGVKKSERKEKRVRGMPPAFSRSLKREQDEQSLADKVHGAGCNAAAFPTYRRKLFWHPGISDGLQFYGSCKYTLSLSVTPRRPLKTDERIDYEAEDEGEEDDEEGEVLGDDEEDDILQQDNEADAENDGFFVPDDYFSEDELDSSGYPNENSDPAFGKGDESNAVRLLKQRIFRAKQQKKVVVVSSQISVQGDQSSIVHIEEDEVLKEFSVITLDENARVLKPEPTEDVVFIPGQRNTAKKRKVEGQKPPTTEKKSSVNNSTLKQFFNTVDQQLGLQENIQ